MRALIQRESGGAFEFADIPVPDVPAGFVRVRVSACGLNPVDVGLSRRGGAISTWPHVLGLDVAGIVDAIGEGVVGWRVGDRVACHVDLRRDGGFAEFALADADAMARIPDEVAFVDAAALPCAGMTARQAVIDRLRVGSGDSVLVTGANGGVGGFAVQLASQAGATVIALASAHHDRARRLGADAVIDYRRPDVHEAVRAACGGEGLDAVVDTVGADSATDWLRTLAHSGGIACIAARADITAVPAFTTAPSVHEIALGAAYSSGRVKDRRRLSHSLAHLLDLVAEGELDPMVTRVICLDEVPAALDEIAQGHTIGKIVMSLEPSPQEDSR